MDDFRDSIRSCPNYKKMMKEEASVKLIKGNDEAFLKEISIIRDLKLANIHNTLNQLIVIEGVYAGYRYLDDIDFHDVVHKLTEEVNPINKEYNNKAAEWVKRTVHNKVNYEEFLNKPNYIANIKANKLKNKYYGQIKSPVNKSEDDTILNDKANRVPSLSKDIVNDYAREIFDSFIDSMYLLNLGKTCWQSGFDTFTLLDKERLIKSCFN